MTNHDRRQPAGQGPARTVTALLVGGVLATWLVAAFLLWGLTPLVIAEPAPVGMRQAADASAVAELVSLFAPVAAVAGAAMLIALALTWRRPPRAAGRVVLFVAGLLASAAALLFGTIGSFEVAWGDGIALAGLTSAVVFVAVGFSACVASLTDWLPGASLVERMMAPSTVPPATPAWERMLPLIVLLGAGWAICTSIVVSKRGLISGEDAWLVAGFLAFITAQMGLPILAGAIATGWREGTPNRLKTLGWASAVGLMTDWLFLLALALGQYYHNLDGTPYTPRSYVVWWGLLGGLLGAFGYSLWGPLTRLRRRGPRLQPRPH